MTDPGLPTPAQLGLPANAPENQYQQALKAAGFGPFTGVEATPVTVVPAEPLPEPSTVSQLTPVVVATFRDPESGASYVVTRS